MGEGTLSKCGRKLSDSARIPPQRNATRVSRKHTVPGIASKPRFENPNQVLPTLPRRETEAHYKQGLTWNGSTSLPRHNPQDLVGASFRVQAQGLKPRVGGVDVFEIQPFLCNLELIVKPPRLPVSNQGPKKCVFSVPCEVSHVGYHGKESKTLSSIGSDVRSSDNFLGFRV